MLFKRIDGENAVVVTNGVYRQCDLYLRDGDLYAKIGSGFVRLYANGTTSQTTTRLETLAYNGQLFSDRMGRLTSDGSKGRKTIAVSDDGQLQIADQRD